MLLRSTDQAELYRRILVTYTHTQRCRLLFAATPDAVDAFDRCREGQCPSSSYFLLLFVAHSSRCSCPVLAIVARNPTAMLTPMPMFRLVLILLLDVPVHIHPSNFGPTPRAYAGTRFAIHLQHCTQLPHVSLSCPFMFRFSSFVPLSTALLPMLVAPGHPRTFCRDLGT